MKLSISNRSVLVGGIAFAAALLSACGGSSEGEAMNAAEACAALKGYRISAQQIALPTTGATVTAASLVPASGSGASAVGEYCSVTGAIHPVSAGAPPIQFSLALPTAWNRKAMQFTGGGYDGLVVPGSSPVRHAFDLAPPVARGYAGFGGDSGHTSGFTGPAAGLDGSFGLNEEAAENYYGDHLRKTRDVAVELIARRYGSAPARTYISGGSGGGRQGLYAASRWPTLYDGVIAYYPVWSAAGLLASGVRTTQALVKPGAWSNPAKQQLVSKSVVGACDALDGAVDGLVSNAAACNFDLNSLRCPSGADDGDACLSSAQLTALADGFVAERSFPYAFANGIVKDPSHSIQKTGTVPGMGYAAPNESVATPILWPSSFGLLDSLVRYFVLRDPAYDSVRFSLTGSEAIQDRMKYISSRMDVNPDLSAFAAKGGKVLMFHGTTDSLIPAAWSDEFYRKASEAMGASATASSLRYYQIPGLGHGTGAYFASVDSLTALERWVEDGVAPTGLIVKDTNTATNGRTRPLCEYPTWPKYNGSGDLNLASSYSCTR